MQMDLETLTKLLSELHEELTVCIEHEQNIAVVSVGGPPSNYQSQDPILLGDFIVDAYNNYLACTKEVCDDPIIQRMPEIEKLGDVDYDAIPDSVVADETNQHEHIAVVKGISIGKNPRLQKMREVAFATKQLQTTLKGVIKTEESQAQSETVGVMTLLENLGEQIGQVQKDVEVQKSTGGNPEEEAQSACHLLEEYNRYLGIVLEGTEDALLEKVFRPLEPVVDKTSSYRDKLSELRLAQSGLLKYLQKMYERSG